MLMIRTVSNNVEVVNVANKPSNSARERRGDTVRNTRKTEKNEKRSGQDKAREDGRKADDARNSGRKGR
jgi:hypothetical protein